MPSSAASRINVLNRRFVHRIILGTSLLVVAAIGAFAVWSYARQSTSVHQQIDAHSAP